MLDRRFILENQDLIRKNIQDRQVSVDFERFLALEVRRKELLRKVEDTRAQANALARNSQVSVEERRVAGQQLKQLENQLAAEVLPLEEEAQTLYLTIPNLTTPESPMGGEDCSRDIQRGKTSLPAFDFAPRDHIALMKGLGMLNLTAGAKVAGSGFYFFTGTGALLEMALIRYALDMAMAEGFTPVATPDVARDSLMQGAGFVPRGNESNTYRLEDSDLNLIATSEITLVGMYADEIMDAAQLPIRLAGTSSCFRSERAHGSATRGIYRVHQFKKAEMVVICTPEQAPDFHLKLREIEQRIFDGLEIPYRVLVISPQLPPLRPGIQASRSNLR